MTEKEQVVIDYFAKHPTATILRYYVSKRLVLAHEIEKENRPYYVDGPLLENLDVENDDELVAYWVTFIKDKLGKQPVS